MKKDKREANAYLESNKIKDIQDETRLMRLNHLIANRYVSAGIVFGIDMVFFLLIQYGWNTLMKICNSLKYIFTGETQSLSLYSIKNMFDFHHSITWWIIILVLIVILDIRLIYTLHVNFGDINKNQKGSQRFTTLQEIQEQYDSIPLKQPFPYSTYYGKGGVPICHYGTYKEFYTDENGETKARLMNIEEGLIYIDRSPVNNEIIGITRSGKGEFFVFPLVDIYSRAENKIYFISKNPLEIKAENKLETHKERYMANTSNKITNGSSYTPRGWYLYSADVYYDEKLGYKECHGDLVAIDEKTLNLGKKEFQEIIKTIENEYNATYNPKTHLLEVKEQAKEDAPKEEEELQEEKELPVPTVPTEEKQEEIEEIEENEAEKEKYDLENDPNVIDLQDGTCMYLATTEVVRTSRNKEKIKFSVNKKNLTAKCQERMIDSEYTFDSTLMGRKNALDNMYMDFSPLSEGLANFFSNVYGEFAKCLGIEVINIEDYIENHTRQTQEQQEQENPATESPVTESEENSQETELTPEEQEEITVIKDDYKQNPEVLAEEITAGEGMDVLKTFGSSSAFSENKIAEEKDISDNEKVENLDILDKISRQQGIQKFSFYRNQQASMVISDPKCELYLASKKTLELRGYKVYLLNLADAYRSDGFNPLQLITDTYKKGETASASQIARALCTSVFAGEMQGGGDNAFFYDNAVFLMSALIMSEIIDRLRADEELNKELFIKHKEKTEAFQNLSAEEKERIWLLADQVEQLKIQMHNTKDKLQKIMLKRKIEELTPDLEKYNYDNSEFVPSTENEKKINMKNILLKFQVLGEANFNPTPENPMAEPINALDEYFNQRDTLDVARCLYAGINLSGGEKVRGSIISTVLSKMAGFNDDMIAKMTAESAFKLEDIGYGEKPIAIFFSQPDYDSSNNFINSIFIWETYYTLAKRATQTANGKCKREVIFILDEFGNIPTIANMSAMITVCLGRNIRFNLIIQSYSMVANRYGEDDATTINGNCGNQIYILTNEGETAKKYSEELGNKTIVNISRMGKKLELSTSKQITESVEEKPLLDPNRLMQLTEGECVVRRVMKRTDLKGRDVKPRPIFNNLEERTTFPFRYQYLDDYFHVGYELDDVNAPSCSHLDMSIYLGDSNKILQEVKDHADPKYKEAYNDWMEHYIEASQKEIGCFADKNKIIKIVREALYEDMREYSNEQLEKISLSDIENSFIPYTANLVPFRRRFYKNVDFNTTEDDVIGAYGTELVKALNMLLGSRKEEIYSDNGWDDEKVFYATTIKQLKEILENSEYPESVISSIDTIVGNIRKGA